MFFLAVFIQIALTITEWLSDHMWWIVGGCSIIIIFAIILILAGSKE